MKNYFPNAQRIIKEKKIVISIVSSLESKDFDIITNRYKEKNEPKIKPEGKKEKLHQNIKSKNTYDFNPIAATNIDPNNEAKIIV